MTLADFLLARIAEDKQRVRAGYPFDNWENHEDDYEWDSDTLMASWHTARCGHRYGERMVLAGEDCDCGVPTRVLADLAAKKEIVKRHTDRDECCEERLGPMIFDAESTVSVSTDSWGGLVTRRSIGHQERLGCVTLMLLAEPYADHPDYREEWKS